jgi:ubiquinone/menaquinone biosynthesis C-methylase UbiE
MTGCRVTAEQILRMYTRYRFASQFCRGKEVLEIACGSGQGLGYLSRFAKRIVGGDYDAKNVKCAQDYYKDRIEIKQMDAHKLPFDNKSFEVVILYEALYYLKYPEKFIKEAQRVLKENGVLLICTANKDWDGFNPSSYSYKYFSGPELFELISQQHFKVELFGDCPIAMTTVKDKVIAKIKRIAVVLHLIPRTMKGKEFIKRVFFGKLFILPAEIEEDMADYCPPVPISHKFPNSQYKVIFAVAQHL